MVIRLIIVLKIWNFEVILLMQKFMDSNLVKNIQDHVLNLPNKMFLIFVQINAYKEK